MKKRVNFSWMKHEQGRMFKTYLALVFDAINIESRKKFNKRLKEAVKLTILKFPKMYKIIKKYYLSKGRELTKKEFKIICFGRIMMMFDFDVEKKTIDTCSEHPINSKILKSYIEKCKQMRDENLNWKEFKAKTKVS